MADELHLDNIKKGPDAWNEWRSGQPDDLIVDLSGANLMGLDLSDTNLRNANLCNTKFQRADLSGTNLRNADACGADFIRAELTGVCLTNSNLQGAKLSSANLMTADLCGADLTSALLNCANCTSTDFSGAILSKARMSETILGDTILVNVKGLDEVIHSGPSIIDHRTIEYFDSLPTNFLRGCGLPESLINYLPSMLNQPISFYSCFISYSHADKVFARRLHDQLQGQGIRCWLDEYYMRPGDEIHEMIDQGIRIWDKVLLCASESALTSWWVDNEIDKAFRKEQQLTRERKKKVLSLIPLNLDGYMFSEKWENGKASQVKARFAADFTGWEKDNDKFEQAFEKVLNALKTDGAGRETPPKSML